MSNLTYEEVAETVMQLDRDFVRVREQSERRLDLYRLKKDPYVPEEIAREGKLRINSAHVIAAAQSIRADLMMNPTEFTVVPLARERDGTVPRKSIEMAETVERGTAIVWGKLNEGRRIDSDVIWHQLISPFAILVLGCNDYSPPDQPDWMSDADYVTVTDKYEKDWIPWNLSCVDPMSCSWMERDGHPVLFSRRYYVTVKDLESQFNQNRASLEPDQRLMLLKGKFEWVSDDYKINGPRNIKSTFQEVEIMWLDDGESIYMAVRDPGDSTAPMGDSAVTGRMLWKAPNPFSRVSAFIVPGNKTPAREPENKYEPYLWPLMQTVDQMNAIRSTRATAARNLAGPHTYIALDPELIKSYQARGEKLPTAHRWKKNETPYLLGDVKEYPSELSTDWDKIEERINEELQRFLPSQYTNLVDPAVLKAATATSILHAAEAGMRTYGPMMSAYDSAIRDMTECMLYSLATHFNEHDIYAFSDGSEVAGGKPLQPGMLAKLNAKALDFPYKLMVKTRGMSQAQAAAQYDLVLRQWVLPDGSKGPATLDDLLDAANYTDPIAQKMKLAQAGIIDVLDPWIKQSAIMVSRDYILADSGINLPLPPEMQAAMAPPGTAPPQGGAMQPGAGAPEGQGQQANARIPANANQTMNAPQVMGPEGGSAPMMNGPTG